MQDFKYLNSVKKQKSASQNKTEGRCADFIKKKKTLSVTWTLLLVIYAGPSFSVRLSSTDTLSAGRQYNYSFGLGGIIASDATPFWLRTNQFGVIPLKGPVLLPSAAIFSDYVHSKKWDWGFHLEAVGNIGNQSTLIIPEAHLKGRWGKLEIFAGRKRQIVGLLGDSLNTSGSYIHSGNSLPLPMVQIGFTDYATIFKGLLGFRGNYAHGWFSANPITKGHFLHQKSLYLRIGRPKWPVRLYGGFNHNVQWGGTIVMANKWHAPGQTTYPSKLIDYWYVISGKRIPTFGYVNPDEYDAIDRGNRIGNHLGTVDFALEIRLPKWTLMGYKQFVYDDGSLFQRINLTDGLHGLSFKNHNPENIRGIRLSGITLEYLQTSNQGGAHFDLDGGRRGSDNYFNHMQYYGWVQAGNTVGTPFIIPSTHGLPSLKNPLNPYYFSANNRVQMVHLGLNGRINKMLFLAKLSFSHNLGMYDRPFPSAANQFSGLMRLELPANLRKAGCIHYTLSVGHDQGDLYRNSFGAFLGIIKKGRL